MIVLNRDFLSAIFGADAPWVHVTDFPYDPNHIPDDRHLAAWKGDYFSRYPIGENTNQYFTISTFYADEKQVARRRKALYRQTHCVVLDDVKEKLSEEAAQLLPHPSWVMETSPGSEQWGYILDTPCTERTKIDNLNDGLIASDLAPDGKDPGQRGVTRYVRLPEGYNTKASKMVDGQPFKCRMLSWQPFNRVKLEELASPFNIKLDAPRREQRVDGAADVDGHPLLGVSDLIHIKEMRSAGRFDITCPWVDEHTGGVDNGAGIFTNADGSIGFKCHHGACQDRSGADLLRHLEEQQPGFGAELTAWKAMRSFSQLFTPTHQPAAHDTPPPIQSFNFLDPELPAAQLPAPPTAPKAQGPVSGDPAEAVFQQMLDALGQERPTSHEARQLAQQLLKAVDELREIDKVIWHDRVCDTMMWSKQDFRRILTDFQKDWYRSGQKKHDFYDTVFYVRELNQFYDWKRRSFYTVEGFQNSFIDQDSEAKKAALQDAMVQKVDKIDYAPGKGRIFQESFVTYGNTYMADDSEPGLPGDASFWLDHWDVLGWGEYREHMLKWMAFTIRYPEKKINHMLLLGSGEGGGKDFMLYPLLKAMAGNATQIDGDTLLDKFNDYLFNIKYLHINETELGDHKEAKAIGAKLKPLAAAPPHTLRLNPKGIKGINVRNVVNCTMTTNSPMPIKLNGPSRRFFALWSDINIRDADGQVNKDWITYWTHRWHWMENGGAEACIHYLRNEVDLSDFNPGAAPKVTEFLREIQELSKTPKQRTIDAFINDEIGLFECDIMSTTDMMNTLKMGSMIAPDLMATEGKWFNVTSIGMTLKEIGGHSKVECRIDGVKRRLWVIRNHAKYVAMPPKELAAEYQRQLTAAKGKPQLTVVQ